MQPLHEKEIDEAKQRLSASGREAGDFAFDVAFMGPDPDGGGMFTVRYEIAVTNGANAKSQSYVGGIGMRWVDAFEDDVNDGAFD